MDKFLGYLANMDRYLVLDHAIALLSLIRSEGLVH